MFPLAFKNKKKNKKSPTLDFNVQIMFQDCSSKRNQFLVCLNPRFLLKHHFKDEICVTTCCFHSAALSSGGDCNNTG